MKPSIEQRLEGWLAERPALRPWVWFILLWLGGLLSVAVGSYGIRWLLGLD